jgi:hypothetical protein
MSMTNSILDQLTDTNKTLSTIAGDNSIYISKFDFGCAIIKNVDPLLKNEILLTSLHFTRQHTNQTLMQLTLKHFYEQRSFIEISLGVKLIEVAREYVFDSDALKKGISSPWNRVEQNDKEYTLYYNYWVFRYTLSSLASNYPAAYDNNTGNLYVSLHVLEYNDKTESFEQNKLANREDLDFHRVLNYGPWADKPETRLIRKEYLCPCITSGKKYIDCCQPILFKDMNNCFGFYSVEMIKRVKEKIDPKLFEEKHTIYQERFRGLERIFDSRPSTELFKNHDNRGSFLYSLVNYAFSAPLPQGLTATFADIGKQKIDNLYDYVVYGGSIWPIHSRQLWIEKDAQGTIISTVYTKNDKNKHFQDFVMMQGNHFFYDHLYRSMELIKIEKWTTEEWEYFFGWTSISPRTHTIIIKSIKLYCEEDFDAATHVIMPQIENNLRRLSQLRGFSIKEPVKNPVLGKEQYIMITKALENAFAPEDNDAKELILRTLSRHGGEALNLRNELAHNWENKPSTGKEYVILLFILSLICSRIESTTKDLLSKP